MQAQSLPVPRQRARARDAEGVRAWRTGVKNWARAPPGGRPEDSGHTRETSFTFTFPFIPLVSLIHRSACISKKSCIVAKNLVFGILVLPIWQVTQLLRASVTLNSKKSKNQPPSLSYCGDFRVICEVHSLCCINTFSKYLLFGLLKIELGTRQDMTHVFIETKTLEMERDSK